MNETSHVTSCGANGSVSSARAFVRSSTVTRGSARSRGWSCPWPTSSAITRARAALEEHVGEAAGRGAEVEAVEPGRVDAERVERVRELLPGARDVRRRALDLERRRLVDLLAGLRVPGHEPGHHERLRLRPALGEATLDEEHVEALLHEVRATRPATISASVAVSASISARRAWARSPAASARRRDSSAPTSTT